MDRESPRSESMVTTSSSTLADGEKLEAVSAAAAPAGPDLHKVEEAADARNGTAAGGDRVMVREVAVPVAAPAEHNAQHTAMTTTTNGDRAAPPTSVVPTDRAPVEQLAVVDAVVDGNSPAYLSGAPLMLLTFGLCMATFVVALDNTIIATAIPKITSEFNSLNDVGWYGSSYLLATTALQPSFGRIYTYFNVKYMYLGALALFEVGSIICATAVDSNMLIIGRTVAGAGASGLFSGGMTIVGGSVTLRRRPLYIAILSSMFGVSSVVGPLLGGVFTDKTTWRWCFWINLPVGAIAIVAVFFFYKHPPQIQSTLSWQRKIWDLDLLGAFFLIAAMVCLLLGLQWGGTVYPWHEPKVWGCLLGFTFMIAIFVYQQCRRGERATIPPRIFLQRTVLWSSLYTCAMNMGIYVHLFYLPFYFQAVKGTSAVDSGIRTIPYLGSIIVCSILVGGGITAIGVYKPFMIIGPIIFTVGAGLIYTLAVDTEAGKWISYQLLAGFGAGAGIQVPFISIQVVLNSKDMPTGNAVVIFFNSLGGAVAISVAQNIFQNGLYTNIPIYAPLIPAKAVIQVGATYLRTLIPSAYLAGVLQAYCISLDNAFIIAIVTGGVSFLFALFVENKSVMGQSLMHGAA